MKKRGVYAVLHVPSGSAYLGGSVDMVSRFTWHRCILRQNRHSSVLLQRLWSRTKEREWAFVVLEFCRSRELRMREQVRMDTWPGDLLNDRPVKGYCLSTETRRRQSVSRARYLQDPASRRILSVNAKKQHEEGNFGRITWRTR
jgi:hypothetical protein